MYGKRKQTSVDNTGNDLCYEIKFEICVKEKNNFFIEKDIFFQTKMYFVLGDVIFLRLLKI